MTETRDADEDKMRALLLALPVPGAHPTDRLAGLPLVTRTALRLARAGIDLDDVLVATTSAAMTEVRDALRHPQLAGLLHFVEVDTVPDALCAAASASASEQRVLVARHDVVAENGVYEALLRAAPAHSATAMMRCASTPLTAPFIASSAGLRALARQHPITTTTTEIALPPAAVVRSVADHEGRRFVFRALFEACRKPVDGLVSRYLNRHLSIWISKRIVDTSVTPNQMSAITFLLGIGAAISVSFGTYSTMLLGAALLQANSILDGVDGELARVRFQQSKLGEWIDTVSDDLSNALFYGGLALGAAKLPAPGPTLAALGAAAVVLQLATMALYYAELIRLGRGDFYALGVGGKAKRAHGPVAFVVTAVGYATKKDFFIFAFLVAAACNVLPWALVPMAMGTLLTFFAGLGLLFRRPRRGQAHKHGENAGK